jgi:hypothetical protein
MPAGTLVRRSSSAKRPDGLLARSLGSPGHGRSLRSPSGSRRPRPDAWRRRTRAGQRERARRSGVAAAAGCECCRAALTDRSSALSCAGSHGHAFSLRPDFARTASRSAYSSSVSRTRTSRVRLLPRIPRVIRPADPFRAATRSCTSMSVW